MAKLEVDMVTFKQEILKSYADVMESLEDKDNQITELKDKISQAHSNDIINRGWRESMDGTGCVRIFQRFVEQYSLRYVDFLGGGDSKAYNEITDALVL